MSYNFKQTDAIVIEKMTIIGQKYEFSRLWGGGTKGGPGDTGHT